MGEWTVTRVNPCELLRTYYGGAFRVRRTSLQVPAGAFFAVGGASEERATPKRKKKRKRGEDALALLVARGKFVPLDERVRCMLQAAYDEVAGAFVASDFLPAWPSGETVASAAGPLEPTLVLSANDARSPSLLCNASNDVQVAVIAVGNEAPSPSAKSPADGGSGLLLLPPRACFAMADVRDLEPLGLASDFKWVVMDPPWENKSARRYATFHHEELLRVDVPRLAHPEACVLAVWVTNKPAYTTFLLEQALPKWGFTLHDTWFWLKLSVNGELVTPLESTHRLPFEKLIIAYRGTTEAARARLRRLLGNQTRVVASVPLRHSWKPPPESFFPASSMAPGDRKIELFARELRPNWTSIGLEVSEH